LTGAKVDIDEIDPDGFDSDECFPLSRFEPGNLVQAQDLRAAKLMDTYRSHIGSRVQIDPFTYRSTTRILPDLPVQDALWQFGG
jgi:hypothetical protein